MGASMIASRLSISYHEVHMAAHDDEWLIQLLYHLYEVYSQLILMPDSFNCWILSSEMLVRRQ
jgi:hypothetical protein